MISKTREFLAGKRGQGMTEYIIILALIAVAAIAIFTLFGKQIRGVVGMMGRSLGGDEVATTETYDGEFSGQETKNIDLSDLGGEDF